MRYNISLAQDTDRLARMVNLTPKEMNKASQRTINKVIPNIQREAGGAIPRAAGASVGGYRRVRSKRKIATVRRLRGEVWQGTLKIPAKYAAGRLRQTRTGVRAGRLFFEGAFLATMRNGYRGVFRRKGAGRAIQQEYIYLDDARSVMERLNKSARRDVTAILEDEVRKSWNKVVG